MVQLRPFSQGYHVGNLNVDSFAGDTPSIGSVEFNELSQQVYGRGGVQPVLRLNGRYFKPSPEAAIPADTLALPTSVADDCNTGKGVPVKVLTEQYAHDFIF